MANNSARIKEIREVLQTGVSSSTVDGTTTTFDLDSLRRELAQLVAEDDTQKSRKRRLTSVNISRLF